MEGGEPWTVAPMRERLGSRDHRRAPLSVRPAAFHTRHFDYALTGYALP